MINNDNKSNSGVNLGTKLLNELMVDIVGGLIPGFLFIIVIFLSIILPIILISIEISPNCTNTQYTNYSMLKITDGGFWWVLMIVCIIFSYVIGHIFYRSDINKPDRENVEKDINNFFNNIQKESISYEDLKKQFIDDINIIRYSIKNSNNNYSDNDNWQKLKKSLPISCSKAIKAINEEKDLLEDKDVLKVLFPEELILESQWKSSEKDISKNIHNVIDFYETKYYENITNTFFKYEDNKNEEKYKNLIICYGILHNQMEIGCDAPNRSEYPYINYYKYLLKRNMFDLLEYVNWFTVEKRSKNTLLSLKLKVQLFANEANAMINKNESHIRMSSSTYHICKFLHNITIGTIFFTLVVSILLYLSKNIIDPNVKHDCEYIWNYIIDMLFLHFNLTYLIACLLPLCMFFLIRYIEGKIINYIHYQRLREIQYTLQIYSQFIRIIDHRKKCYASEGPVNNKKDEHDI